MDNRKLLAIGDDVITPAGDKGKVIAIDPDVIEPVCVHVEGKYNNWYEHNALKYCEPEESNVDDGQDTRIRQILLGIYFRAAE